MQTFVDYYNSIKKDFKFTVKLAKNDLPEETIGQLECVLGKFNLKSMGKMKKTVIQHSPLDFPNVKDSEVYITEVVLEYPVTPDALIRQISECTGINQNAIAVYSATDPRRQYTQDVIDRVVNNKEFKENYETRLGNLEKWETEPSYGESYNTAFLKSMALANKESCSSKYYDDEPVTNTDTVTGDETGAINVDSVLKDRWRNAGKFIQNLEKVRMMSNPS